MTVLPPALPFTVSGRSPFDTIRIRWGGLGALGLGIGLLFTGAAAGVFFGILLAALGVATLVLSGFGAVYWYDIPTPRRYIVGTGAVLGFLTFIIFVGGVFLVASIVQMVARNR